MNEMKQSLVLMVIAAMLGAVIGGITWAILMIMNLGIEFIWHDLPEQAGADFYLYPVIVCAIGGILIGLWCKKYGPYPHEMAEIIKAIKMGKRISYRNLQIVVIAALLPLIFGGSLGPEAGLTGVIAGLCFWFSDRLKHSLKEVEVLPEIGVAATVGAIFGSPLFGFMNGIENQYEKVAMPKNRKIVLYFLAIICGTGMVIFLNSLIGREMGLGRFPEISEISKNAWLLVLPLAMVGVAGGYLFGSFEKILEKMAKPLEKAVITKAVIGGVLLGTFGIFLPYTMFSGEHELKEVMVIWQNMGSTVLFLTGICKLLVSAICKAFGWRGGKIFPTVFSGVCIGYAVAPYLPIDPIFCVAVVTAALTGFVMEKPIAVIFLLLICFPVDGIIPLSMGAAIGGAFPKLFKKNS